MLLSTDSYDQILASGWSRFKANISLIDDPLTKLNTKGYVNIAPPSGLVDTFGIPVGENTLAIPQVIERTKINSFGGVTGLYSTDWTDTSVESKVIYSQVVRIKRKKTLPALTFSQPNIVEVVASTYQAQYEAVYHDFGLTLLNGVPELGVFGLLNHPYGITYVMLAEGGHSTWATMTDLELLTSVDKFINSARKSIGNFDLLLIGETVADTLRYRYLTLNGQQTGINLYTKLVEAAAVNGLVLRVSEMLTNQMVAIVGKEAKMTVITDFERAYFSSKQDDIDIASHMITAGLIMKKEAIVKCVVPL